MYRVPVCLLFACLLVLGGCRHRHKPTRVYRPLIPLPPPAESIQLDPQPTFDYVKFIPPPLPLEIELPPPPKPPIRRRPVKPERKPDTTPVPDPPVAPQPPPVPPPQLGVVMTDEARRQLLSATDEFISQARVIVDRYRNRRLDQRQKELFDQVNILTDRARNLRETDVSAAKVLAERALKIAQDLANEAK